MLDLVRTLNRSLEVGGLEKTILESAFSTYWPQFEATFKDIVEKISALPKTEARSEQDLLAEILSNTRSLNTRVRALELMTRRIKRDDSLSQPVDASFLKDLTDQGKTNDEILEITGFKNPEIGALLDLLRETRRRTD